jgi:hypothetical protein
MKLMDFDCTFVIVQDKKILYKMSRITWINFSYFKCLYNDLKDQHIFQIEFVDDMSDFWTFLKNERPLYIVDFALNVKNICDKLGLIDDGNVYCGRLDNLLLDAGMEYFKKIECLLIPKADSFAHVLKNSTRRQEIKLLLVHKFMNKTLSDPRCYSVLKEIVSIMNT